MGGGRLGEKGREILGEERVGSGIPKVEGSRRNREKICSTARYFLKGQSHQLLVSP